MAGRWGHGCTPAFGSLTPSALFHLKKTKTPSPLCLCLCWTESAFPRAIILLCEERKQNSEWMDEWMNERRIFLDTCSCRIRSPLLLRDGGMKPHPSFILPHPWVLAVRAKRGRWARLSPCWEVDWAGRNWWAPTLFIWHKAGWH